MKNKTVLLWCFLPPGGETLRVTTLNKVTDLPCQLYFDQDKALQQSRTFDELHSTAINQITILIIIKIF